MEISKLFGLPAHPLIVHIPVVLLPIAAIGAILMVLSASWRARIGWLVVIAAGVSLLFVQLAIGSGEALQESVKETELVKVHAELGEAARPYVAVFFLAVLALMLYDRLRTRRSAAGDASAVTSSDKGTWRDPVMAIIAVVVLVSSVLSGITVYRAGHSGASSVWSGVQVSGGEGGEGGEGSGG
ncbi:MAG: DUF2231 domain-containing protein [Actinomycetota bacterium]